MASPAVAGDDSATAMAREMAQSFKAQGNAAFKKGDNSAAVSFYTQAIELDPDDHVFFSNRSAAYLAMGGAKSKALKELLA